MFNFILLFTMSTPKGYKPSGKTNKLLNEVATKLSSLKLTNKKQVTPNTPRSRTPRPMLSYTPRTPQKAYNPPKRQSNRTSALNTPNLSTGAGPLRRTANVVGTLAKSTKPPKNINLDLHYINCRLAPFGTMGGTGIPDGSNIRKFVVDYRYFTDITITASCNFAVLATPTIPNSLWYKTDTLNSLKFTDGNGTVPIFANAGTVGSSCYTINDPTGWSPLSFPSEFANQPISTWLNNAPVNSTAGTITNPANPYGATKARFITMAHKFYYTGAASNCSGTFTSSDVNITTNDGEQTLNPVAITIPDAGFGNYNSSGPSGYTQPSYAANRVNTVPAQFNISTNTMQLSTVTTRLESGVYIAPKHGGLDPSVYRWVDVHNMPLYWLITGTSQTFNSTHYNTFSAVATTPTITTYLNNGGILAYDNDWSSTLVQIANAQSGFTFRIESVVCVEYQLQQGSPFERATLTSTKSMPQLQAAAITADKMPTAMPVAAQPYQFVVEAAKVAKRIGATVGAIAQFI